MFSTDLPTPNFDTLTLWLRMQMREAKLDDLNIRIPSENYSKWENQEPTEIHIGLKCDRSDVTKSITINNITINDLMFCFAIKGIQEWYKKAREELGCTKEKVDRNMYGKDNRCSPECKNATNTYPAHGRKIE